MESYLQDYGSWIKIIQGVIFIICVLSFRQGIMGELERFDGSSRVSRKACAARDLRTSRCRRRPVDESPCRSVRRRLAVRRDRHVTKCSFPFTMADSSNG